jgi:glyoxylase-like metal-dependent hydrolase (beta-lactamase superfamily II)
VFQAKDWFTSFFVRAVPDGVILIDAGFREGASERALEDLGHTPDEVRHVFLTHGHGDHLGLLPELTNAEIHGLVAEEDLVAEESGGEARITDPVADGDVLDVGVQVEVFAVPGHTAGSAVYLVDGVLLLGDSAIVDRDGVLVPVNEDRSDDPAKLVRSMQALAERLGPRKDEIDWLAPSHSAPVQGFQPLAHFGG